MSASIFEFDSYKAYLLSQAGPSSQRRGVKTAMAKALNCQATYVSQVLNGNAHLSLEQADALNTFFGHSKDEADFFLMLVQWERAGTESLRAYFKAQIEDRLKRRLVLTQRLGAKNDLSDTDRVRYYSSWVYAALHIAATIPELQDRSEMAAFFQLPLAKVNETIAWLLKAGLLREDDKGRLSNGANLIRLGNESPNIVRHHSNWRLRAMEALDREQPGDLHYSGVVSLSKKDALKIKDRMLENLKRDLEIVKESPEEELYSLCLDFFTLRR